MAVVHIRSLAAAYAGVSSVGIIQRLHVSGHGVLRMFRLANPAARKNWRGGQTSAAGAAFVKTSTGFGGGGATADDIALMRRIVGPEMGVKASGGVRNRAAAEKMIAAGATRIGASASVAIVTGGEGKSSY